MSWEGGVGKIGEVVSKKGVSLIFILTNPFHVIFLWLFDVLYYHFVLQEEASLIASNQQTYDFYKWIIFEKKRHSGKEIFDISELFIKFNKDSCFELITGGVSIYLSGCV